jgi:ABC-type multidrug transport system fused ATPase/permease subunit
MTWSSTRSRSSTALAFLDGGRIVEEGTHDELLDRGGRYAEFTGSHGPDTPWRAATSRRV